MKSHPRWIWWTAAAVTLWAAWVTFAYLPLRQRDQRESALRADWVTRQHDMLARIETAPAIMKQIGDLERKLDSASLMLPQAHDLKDYLETLADRARMAGIRSVEVKPELASMMALTKSNTQNSVMLDTLVVELVATGRFQPIGTWLDQVESEPAFRHWRFGRWDKGEEPGTVKFSGMVAFVIAIPGAKPS